MPSNLIIVSISIVSFAAIVFYSRRLCRYLCHFQELDYDRSQFKSWLVDNSIYDKKGSAIATIAALAIELTHEQILLSLGISALAAVGIVYLGFWEPDPRKTGKFRLQSTPHANRLYNIALSLYSFCFILTVTITYLLGANDDIACYWLIVIIAIQSAPIWLFLASRIQSKIGRNS